jgi:hypothetical protein
MENFQVTLVNNDGITHTVFVDEEHLMNLVTHLDRSLYKLKKIENISEPVSFEITDFLIKNEGIEVGKQ